MGARNRSLQAWLPLLLVPVGLAVYLNSFKTPFLFDDTVTILHNSHITALGSFWKVLFDPARTSVSGRPLAALSLSLNYAVGGYGVWGYHAVNVALHVLAGLLLYGVLRRTFESRRLAGRYGALSRELAFAISALWLAHPLQTQAVTYVSHRTLSLMSVALLTALYGVIRGAQAGPRAVQWHRLAVLFCGLGMGTREDMAVAPLLILLYDRVFLARSFKEIASRRRFLYAGLAATWLLLAACVIPNPRTHAAAEPGAIAPWTYALLQPRILLHYLRLTVWPHPLVLYYAWPVPVRAVSELLPSAVIASLIITCLAGARRHPEIAFAGAWIFCLLAPSSLVPIPMEFAAERRMYLPLAAVLTLAVIAAYRLVQIPLHLLASERLQWDISAGAFALILLILGGLTLSRNLDYASPSAMWSHAIAHQPRRPGAAAIPPHLLRLQNNYATALCADRRFHEARRAYETALRISAGEPAVQYNYGLLLLELGDESGAFKAFAAALRLKPDFESADPCFKYLRSDDAPRARSCFSQLARRPEAPQP